MSKFAMLALVSILSNCAECTVPAHAADGARGTTQSASAAGDYTNAYNLYNQKNYSASADAFEAVIKTASPNARLYYYAVLASNESGRHGRAKQLAQYLATTFPTTQEAAYVKRLFPEIGAPEQKVASSNDLPDSVKNMLTPEMRALLATDAGKLAVSQVIKDKQKDIDTIRQAEKQGVHVKPAQVASAMPRMKNGVRSEFPFTAEDIARDGAGGIDQSRYPNCWFEASMSALAQLPRGQKLLSSMIRSSKENNTDYIVRFPNDGVQYTISPELLQKTGIHDKALWSSIIECAQLQKFPENQGAEGAYADQSRLEVGLQCITGCKAEIINPSTASPQEISSFVGGAITSANPIVAATFGAQYFAGGGALIIPQHAYTIIGFDSSKNMVIFRNPHGKNSQRFVLTSDPNHYDFQQLDDGIVKMSVPLVQKHFYSIARSFI